MLSKRSPFIPVHDWMDCKGVYWYWREETCLACSPCNNPTTGCSSSIDKCKGSVLIYNPTLFSRPGKSSGRPDTIAPYTTLLLPVYRCKRQDHIPCISVLIVMRCFCV